MLVVKLSVPSNEQNSVDPFISAVCVAFGNMADAEVPLRHCYNMFNMLIDVQCKDYNNVLKNLTNIVMESFIAKNLIANKSHAETFDMLTDMFCSNQWRADQKQEIARVQGCSED